MTRKWFLPVFALLLALALGTAVMAQAVDDDLDDFDINVTNPFVTWTGGGFITDPIVVEAEFLDRYYGTEQDFNVVSLTPFRITVAAVWQAVGGIKVNTNNPVMGGNNPNNAFDVMISDWAKPGEYTNLPSTQSATRDEVQNTLNVDNNGIKGGARDDVDFSAAVYLVIVDEVNALDDGLGNTHDTTGYNALDLTKAHRFDAFPTGAYTVDVTVTITEM